MSETQKVFSLGCITLFLLFITLSVSLHALSLEEAVYHTIKTNPDILQKEQNLFIVKEDKSIARSGFFPKLRVSSGYGVAQEEITPQYRVSGAPVQRIDLFASVSLNLFNGFGTLNDMQAQGHRISSAEHNIVESKGVIALKVIEAYISMMKQKTILSISRENVSIISDILDQLKEKDASGFGNASDLSFVSGKLTLARINEVINESNFMQAKVIFESMYGTSIDITTTLEPRFEYSLPKTLNDAALIAFDNNPSIKVGDYNSRSARSSYQKSKSLYYPKLDLEIKGSWFDESIGYDYRVNSSYAMVYMTYNIFNGLADSAGVEKEFYNFKLSHQYLESAKRDVTKRLGSSWVAFVKIKPQIELLTKMTEYSKKTKEGYYEEFAIGKRTLIDLINVNNDYNSARQSLEIAKYDAIVAQFRILEATGGIVDYFLSRAKALNLSLKDRKDAPASVYDILEKMDAYLLEDSKTKKIKKSL